MRRMLPTTNTDTTRLRDQPPGGEENCHLHRGHRNNFRPLFTSFLHRHSRLFYFLNLTASEFFF